MLGYGSGKQKTSIDLFHNAIYKKIRHAALQKWKFTIRLKLNTNLKLNPIAYRFTKGCKLGFGW
jgi:hypothetical protein